MPINLNHDNIPENICIPFFEKELLSLVEVVSYITNWSILENPQLGRLSDCCYSYCDKCCDWWIEMGGLKYDWLM